MDVRIALPCGPKQEINDVIREYSEFLRKAGAKLLRRGPAWSRSAERLEFDIRTDDLRGIAEALEGRGIPLFIVDDDGNCSPYYTGETTH